MVAHTLLARLSLLPTNVQKINVFSTHFFFFYFLNENIDQIPQKEMSATENVTDYKNQ